MSKRTAITCDGCGKTVSSNPAIIGDDGYYAVKFYGTCMDWETTSWDYCTKCWKKMTEAIKQGE